MAFISAAELFKMNDDRFGIGKCYSISRRMPVASRYLEVAPFYNPISGHGCIFRFEKKIGIHYCFREIHGNWNQTFTAQQLIGKTIKEVSHEGM